MHESVLPQRPPPSASGDLRVHTDLARLVALKYLARGFSFLPRQPVNSVLSGRHASRIRGRGLEFEDIRGYRPGDDVRSIDWKVTARTRQPHTRVFTEERDRPVLLLVDQRAAMFFGTRHAMKSVTAAEAAALGAWRALGVGDRVGAVVFDDTSSDEIAPRRDHATVLRILRAVVDRNRAMHAGIDSIGGASMLNRVIESATRLARHDHLVVVISDFDGADDATREMLKRLAVHNDVLCVPVYDPSAEQLPQSGDLRVSDGRLEVLLPLGSAKVRREVAEFASGRIAAILEFPRHIGVPVLPLSAGEDAAAQVLKLLGAGRR